MKALVLEQAGPDPRLTVTDLPPTLRGRLRRPRSSRGLRLLPSRPAGNGRDPPPRRPNTPHPRPRGRRRRDRGWPPRHHRPPGRPRRLPPHRRLRTVPVVRPGPGTSLPTSPGHRPRHEGRHGPASSREGAQPRQNSRRNPLVPSLPPRCPIGVAVKALDKAQIQDGETVLVTGASGGLGAHLSSWPS